MQKFIYIILAVSLCACGNKRLSPKEYMLWFGSKENPLNKKQAAGKIEYTGTYTPMNFYIAKNILNGAERSGVDSSIYFRLKIAIEGHQTDPLHYNITQEGEDEQRVSYLMSEGKDDMLLIVGQDTVAPILHHFERTYHAGNSILLTYVFDHSMPENTNAYFIYNDRLFGNGLINFNYTKKELNQIPQLQ